MSRGDTTALTYLINFWGLLLSALCSCQAQAPLSAYHDSLAQASLAFQTTWETLGPFRIGTREAIWGADPLEALGGFKDLSYNETTLFPSSLVPNATTKWSQDNLKVESGHVHAAVHLEIGYHNVDWTFQQQVYGWSALQYQAWTRGVLENSALESSKVWVYPQGILELHINDQHFFGGDFFTFNRAPILVELQPGLNTFNVRLVRDVRSMGGTTPPILSAKILVELAKHIPEIVSDLTIAPDVVENRLPSRYFSVTVRNPTADWIVIDGCAQQNFKTLWPSSFRSIRIAPGQVRPIGLEISNNRHTSTNLSGVLSYHSDHESEQPKSGQIPFTIKLKHASMTEASKYTFLHPSGVVNYAVLKPPKIKSNQTFLPLLLQLHGAGVEADSDQLRHSLDGMSDLEAFTLFPTGMSTWSGDDWHLWGTADTLSAIQSVHDWMVEMQWNGTRVMTDRIIVAGHSNGGQGTWFFATHFPDRTLAAAPASGYSSIENYVPYSVWRDAEPLKTSILNNARSNYHHELLLENLAYIPVMQQHGSADDNVPPYHSRLMSALRSMAGLPSDYIELAGKPHWWEGAMTTTPMQSFYRQSLKLAQTVADPDESFSMVIPGCGQIESKFGIIVDQLQSPDRFGRVDVIVDAKEGHKHWHLITTNVHRLHFDLKTSAVNLPSCVTFDLNPENHAVGAMTSQTSCVKTVRGEWKCSEEDWKAIGQRYGRQQGALDAIMQSKGAFQIVSCSDDLHVASQISRNMFQYYGADSTILACEQYHQALEEPGNIILVESGPVVTESVYGEFPITIDGDQIMLRSGLAVDSQIIPIQPGVGANFLRPLHDERLELVIWGSDNKSIQQAARFMPTITGSGQPDFVVFGPKMMFNGHGSVLAMGFLDQSWNISMASYLP